MPANLASAGAPQPRVSPCAELVGARCDLVVVFIGVKEDALSLGFSDAGYSSRLFSKHKRCTPTEFRERAQRQLSRETAA